MPHEHEWQFVSFGGIYAPGTANFVCVCGNIKQVKTRFV